MEKIRLGELDCLKKRSPKEAQTAIILLHGYGANMSDLAPLVDHLPAGACWDWYFPDAPIDLGPSPYMSSKAWFHIDMQKISQNIAQRDLGKYFNEYPEGFKDVAQTLTEALKTLQDKYHNIIIGGFSQGSMLAAELSLTTLKEVSGLILLSTTFVSAETLDKKLDPLPQFPIFQSHGNQDPVLPIESAKLFKQELTKAGINIDYHEFGGGHEIPGPILIALNQFLLKVEEDPK